MQNERDFTSTELSLYQARALSEKVDETIKGLNVTFSGNPLSLSNLFVTINEKEYSVARLIEASLFKNFDMPHMRGLIEELEEIIVNDAIIKTRGNQTLTAKKIKCNRVTVRSILNRRRSRIKGSEDE